MDLLDTNFRSISICQGLASLSCWVELEEEDCDVARLSIKSNKFPNDIGEIYITLTEIAWIVSTWEIFTVGVKRELDHILQNVKEGFDEQLRNHPYYAGESILD